MLSDPRTREAMKREAIRAASDAILSGASHQDVLIAAQKAIRDFLYHYNPELNYSKFS